MEEYQQTVFSDQTNTKVNSVQNIVVGKKKPFRLYVLIALSALLFSMGLSMTMYDIGYSYKFSKEYISGVFDERHDSIEAIVSIEKSYDTANDKSNLLSDHISILKEYLDIYSEFERNQEKYKKELDELSSEKESLSIQKKKIETELRFIQEELKKYQ